MDSDAAKSIKPSQRELATDSESAANSSTEVRRLLVVDDNPAIHEDFRKVLRLSDNSDLDAAAAELFGEEEDDNPMPTVSYEVESALQGEEAYEMVVEAHRKGRPYWVMFVDMRMPPGWDGLTTIQKIWEKVPDIQTVICTAYTDYSWQQIVDGLGVSDRLLLIQKPFSHLEVQQAALTLTTKWALTREVQAHMQRLSEHVRRLEEEIERREKAEKQAAYNLVHDPLTGLANRVLLKDRLSMAQRRASHTPDTVVGLGCLDLDGFRVLTEGLGQKRGDELLCCVAERLQAASRGGDTLARSGDEFWIVLDQLGSPDQINKRLQELVGLVARPFVLSDGTKVDLTATAGYTVITDNSRSANDHVVEANTALSEAKRSARGHVMPFESEMLRSAMHRVRIQEEIKSAIDNREFRLHFQPIISLADGRIHGFEGLARWHHPERGIVPPMEFIPIAEKSRLIIPLGRWVIEEALIQQRVLEEKAGRPIMVSLNVSSIQVSESDLLADVKSAMERVGHTGENVNIELTESGIMDDPDKTIEILQGLHQLQMKIYVDDFGTGYSSLSYLQRLPVDVLKVDRSFVKNIDQRSDDLAITRTVISLAQALHLRVVAEGVETDTQLQLLRALGCGFGQGYFFSKPLPVEDALALLERDPRW